MIENTLKMYIQKRGKSFLDMEAWGESSNLIVPKNKIALYIHIPFCKNICGYCSFTKFIYNEETAKSYFISLKKELLMYKEKGFIFDSVYIGGGTPTVNITLLLDLIKFIKSNFRIDNISIESTINDLSLENASKLKIAGVNRISIGIQSFKKSNCEIIGREEVKEVINKDLSETYNLEKKIESINQLFNTLNIDIIFNITNQSFEELLNELNIISHIGVSQITFYPLMPNHDNEKFSKVNYDNERKLYENIEKFMIDKGYIRNSVWCFSKKTDMITEYFVSNNNYVGVGCGAISFVNGEMRVNTFSLNKYQDYLANNKLPLVLKKRLSEKEYVEYYVLTSFFGLSLDRKEFERKFDATPEKLMFKLNIGKKLGYIIDKDHKIVLSKKSYYLVSVLMREFFSSLNFLRDKCRKNNI